MSSNTQVQVQSVTEVLVETAGKVAFNPDRILGSGGTALLEATLRELPLIRSELGEEAAGALDWEPVEGRLAQYATKVEGISVTIDLGAGVTRVYATGSGWVRDGTRVPQLNMGLVSKKVNQLLAVAVAQRVKQQLTQYVRQKQLVRSQVMLTASAGLRLRALAEVRVRA